ncbi:MAG: helix-turn-helix domain-containing protein [Actinobacteria bacterium]|nr:helix-turn-helix domain-containing protein [Actinomycetota bacterium]
MTNEIMDVKELAKYLGFSEAKIYRLINKRQIPFAKIGGQYRFQKTTIDEWLARQTEAQLPVAGLDRVRQQADALTKRLLLIALLTKELEPDNVRPIITGGQAVEFYTSGGYATRDIDLVSHRSDLIDRTLRRWGFQKEGRHWYSEDFDTLIEVPAAFLAGDMSRISEVQIDGLKVYIIGIEDIIIDRLNAAVHWGSTDDMAWAKELAALNADMIDWNYLKERSAEENVLEAAEFLESEIEGR